MSIATPPALVEAGALFVTMVSVSALSWRTTLSRPRADNLPHIS